VSRGRSFIRGVGILSVAALVAQGAALLAAPLLSRLFAPEEFGVFAVYYAVVAFLPVVVGLRSELSIPGEGDGLMAAVIGVAGMVLSALGVAAVVSLLLAVTWFDPGLEFAVILVDHLPLVAAGALASSWAHVMGYMLVRDERHGALAAGRLVIGFGGVTLQVSFGLMGWGASGMLAGDAVARICAAVLFALVLASRGRRPLGCVWRLLPRAMARIVRRAPVVIGWSLASALALELPVIMVTQIYGVTAAGLFALATRVAWAPHVVLGQSVAQAYFGAIGRIAREERATLAGFHGTQVRLLIGVGGAVMIALAAAGPALYPLVFGQRWVASGYVLQMIAAMGMVRLVVLPFRQSLVVLGRTGVLLAWEGGAAVATLATFAAAAWFGWSMGVCLLTWSVVVGAVYLGLAWHQSRLIAAEAE